MKRYYFAIFIVLLSLFGVVANYFILKEDENDLFILDMQDSYSKSSYYYQLLTQNRFIEIYTDYTTDYGLTYGPLFILQPIFFFMFFGVREDIASFSNILYLPILLISTFFIGKKLGGDKLGYISTCILFLLPSTLAYSRIFLPDFALSAVLSSGFMLSIYAENFRNKGFSMLLGLVSGIGMLIKYSYLLYMFPFIVIIGLHDFLINGLNRKQVENITIFALIILIFCLIWYPFNLNNIIKIRLDSNEGFKDDNKIDDYGKVFMVTSWYFHFFKGIGLWRFPFIIFYASLLYLLVTHFRSRKQFSRISLLVFCTLPFWYFIDSYILPLFLVVLILGVILWFKKWPEIRNIKLIWGFCIYLGIILFLLIFTLPSRRYLLPLLPIISIVAGYAILLLNMKVRFKKNFLIILIFALMILNYAQTRSYDPHIREAGLWKPTYYMKDIKDIIETLRTIPLSSRGIILNSKRDIDATEVLIMARSDRNISMLPDSIFDNIKGNVDKQNKFHEHISKYDFIIVPIRQLGNLTKEKQINFTNNYLNSSKKYELIISKEYIKFLEVGLTGQIFVYVKKD